ncbi:P-loop NTPase fold protein [Chitinophaga barathri]|uniref:KAP NTPase domain-containing protein n=1 Tax=Chitinophaga barathri TaxID=1647451 RepID=A0A3N4MIE6_9BACT|nr:P-loop NTPase fold protein [Chitinophaga barathri]RPD39429.1 hypothetical protein EG028_20115 [Chitinophaga barathri]
MDIEFKINHALATESLYSFIDKRSKSEDYKKHLGIISIIRKDFETLNGLFVDHHEEIDKVADDLRQKFRKKFRQPLERIILYIDDLDRCPEDSVVQVLEAVNLLMAFPLFVVIVGVDPRWVKNALIKKHAIQFANYSVDHLGREFDVIDPSNYLEKIFQIPFRLKEAKDVNVREMIKELANLKSRSVEKGVAIDLTDAQSALQEDEKPTLSSKGNNIIINDVLTISEDYATIEELAELFVLTNEEVALMQDMSEIVGNNPRAIKRFVNTFRIAKAHGELSNDVAFSDRELPAILLLLALPLGKYRALLPSFEMYIEKGENINNPITSYLQPIHKIGLLDELKHKLNVTLSVKGSFGLIGGTQSSIFLKHISFIKRFTFDNI